MKTKTLFAVLATALLALGATALAVEAKETGRPDGRGPPEKAEERRAEAEAKREEAKEKMQARCAAFDNETRERRCEHLVGAAFKARRAANAISKAIEAHERILERVNASIVKVEEKLESGNFTANETAKLEKRLERLEARQDRILEKIEKLEAKLEALKAKWAQVREHVAEMREKRHDGDDEEEDDETSTSSPAPSTTSPPPSGNSTSG